MLDILSNKQIYNEIKQKTRNIIKQKYEQKMFWDLLLSEYNYLIKKNVK